MESCIFSILSSKRGITFTKKLTLVHDTQSWFEVQWNKVICKLSAQYLRACWRKVRKTVSFPYSKFQKGHNAYKNWRHSNLICSTVNRSHMQNFNSMSNPYFGLFRALIHVRLTIQKMKLLAIQWKQVVYIIFTKILGQNGQNACGKCEWYQPCDANRVHLSNYRHELYWTVYFRWKLTSVYIIPS